MLRSHLRPLLSQNGPLKMPAPMISIRSQCHVSGEFLSSPKKVNKCMTRNYMLKVYTTVDGTPGKWTNLL